MFIWIERKSTYGENKKKKGFETQFTVENVEQMEKN